MNAVENETKICASKYISDRCEAERAEGRSGKSLQDALPDGGIRCSNCDGRDISCPNHSDNLQKSERTKYLFDKLKMYSAL